MDPNTLPAKPRLRGGVEASVGDSAARLSMGGLRCTFEFPEEERSLVAALISDLGEGGRSADDLAARTPGLASRIPGLLEDFDRLRLLVDSDPPPLDQTRTGLQLYREVRRLAERVAARTSRSAFYRALADKRATREQMIGYALEYYWIVKSAPGLIGPALASAHGARERQLLQDFLKSELGHDRFLGAALESVGVTEPERELHQPLPATFALGASLGVYARQHPLSFRAVLFLFERSQPEFIDAFDDRCRDLGLPERFFQPLRRHADINEDYDHEDVSRDLMALEGAVPAEACAVVKRHVVLMVETLVLQEEQILAYYATPRSTIARLFD